MPFKGLSIFIVIKKTDLVSQIRFLFAALLVAVVLVSGGGSASEQTPALLSQVNTDAVLTGYRAFFDKFANLPAGVAGILMGASLLLLMEKFLDSRRHAIL